MPQITGWQKKIIGKFAIQTFWFALQTLKSVYDADMSAGGLYLALGKVIKSRRERLGITQKEIARALNLSRPSIANIEGGRQVLAVDQLVVLAEELGIRPATLLNKAIRTREVSKYDSVDEEMAKKWNLTAPEKKIFETIIASARFRVE